MRGKICVTSDYIETTAIKFAGVLAESDAIKKITLLPNSYFDGKFLHGCSIKTGNVIIPSILRDTVGKGTLVVKVECSLSDIDTNKDILRMALMSVRLDNGDFVSIGSSKKGDTYIVVRASSYMHSSALLKKYSMILNKKKGLSGFKYGTKGYTEYIMDYKSVTRASCLHRNSVATEVINILSRITNVNEIKRSDYPTNTLQVVGEEFEYHLGASPINDSTGVICGDINSCIYMVGTREIDGLPSSYPSTLGRVIGKHNSKIQINKQALTIDMKGVSGWMDENTDKEAPYNFKSIQVIKDDCCGTVFAVTPIKTIINIRGY